MACCLKLDQLTGAGHLWKKVKTFEDEEWNRRLGEPNPLDKDQGARAVLKFAGGTVLTGEIAVANADPHEVAGLCLPGRKDCLKKREPAGLFRLPESR